MHRYSPISIPYKLQPTDRRMDMAKSSQNLMQNVLLFEVFIHISLQLSTESLLFQKTFFLWLVKNFFECSNIFNPEFGNLKNLSLIVKFGDKAIFTLGKPVSYPIRSFQHYHIHFPFPSKIFSKHFLLGFVALWWGEKKNHLLEFVTTMEICMMHARNVRFMQNTLWFSREGLKVKDIHLHRYRNLHMPKWFASSRSANKGGRQYRRYDTDPDSVVYRGHNTIPIINSNNNNDNSNESS